MPDGNLARELSRSPASSFATVTAIDSENLKRTRSVECVLGAFKYEPNSHLVGAVLLGLFDDTGNFRPIGSSSALSCTLKRRLTHHLEALRRTKYCDHTPAGDNKCWAPSSKTGWIPVKPQLVVEVEYEHFMDGRIRRDTNVAKWCANHDATSCTFSSASLNLGSHSSVPWKAVVYD